MKANKQIAVLILVLVFLLCSCGTVTEESKTTNVSKDIVSSETEDKNPYWENLEKELQFDDVSNERKSVLRDGKDKYSLDMGDDLCVYLSFDPNNYVVTDENNSVFELERLLCDFGWVEKASSDDNKRTYGFANGEMTIKLTLLYGDRANSGMRLTKLNYDLLQTGNQNSYFYTYSERYALPTNNVECEFGFDDEADIMLDSTEGVYVSQNDIYLLAYIISWVNVMPETAPFLYVDNIRDYYSNYEPEYQKELQHDIVLLK